MFQLASLAGVGRIGRYEVLGRLAVGGMAEVFLARESGPRAASRELVVKRVLPHALSDTTYVDGFAQEARLCMRLRHPGICPIYEFGEDGSDLYLAMEWIHGVSLREILQRAEERDITLPIPIVVRIIANIAGALHYAHEARDETHRALGIVHRDVTPENIMVSYGGVPKLIDFGVAKAESQTQKTQAGVLKGKFAYMSPEQYRGERVDGRSDLFSLGVCLYEALTGEALYQRDSEYETVAAIVLDPQTASARAKRPDVPEELDAMLQRALAKDRNERFATADELQEALENFLAKCGHSVRAKEISGLMQDWFGEEFRAGPTLDRSPVVGGGRRAETPMEETERFALEADLDHTEEHFSRRSRRKRNLVGTLAALIVVLLTAGVSLYALNGGSGAENGQNPGTTSS